MACFFFFFYLGMNYQITSLSEIGKSTFYILICIGLIYFLTNHFLKIGSQVSTVQLVIKYYGPKSYFFSDFNSILLYFQGRYI